MRELIKHYCCRGNLSTYDPYDIWKTSIGYRAKRRFNRNRWLGIGPAAALQLADTFCNVPLRHLYRQQEYPIVRALAAQALLNLYRQTNDKDCLEYAKLHLEWLEANTCAGYGGACWGLGFPHTVSRNVEYDRNTPFSTITPYALEAFIQHAEVTGSADYEGTIESVFEFLEKDLRILKESDEILVTSYGPTHDRVVVNAVSYTMLTYALLLSRMPTGLQEQMRNKIHRLYGFIQRSQRTDGSWMYSPEGRSFIDCFHSCIVLKNIIKTQRQVALENVSDVVVRGYAYVKSNFFDTDSRLFRRFTIKNKPNLIRFDLYDNAEMLNLSILMQDGRVTTSLVHAIDRIFRYKKIIYSQIDVLGNRRHPDTLRWAVMPYLYSLSQLV